MTTLKEWGLFTIVAALAGFMNGALGLGAGVALSALLVPFGLVKDYKTAIGTTILAILPPLSFSNSIALPLIMEIIASDLSST